MSVNLEKYQELFDSSHQNWDRIRETYSAHEFSLLLRNEKLRSERSGVVFSYIKVRFNRPLFIFDKAGAEKYHLFRDYLTSQIHSSDICSDIKYFWDNEELGILLLDTHPHQAKQFVETLINNSDSILHEEYYHQFIRWIHKIELTAFPISKVIDHCRMLANPVVVNDFKWNQKGAFISQIVDSTRLVLDWKYESFKENPSTLNNAIVRDSSQTVHTWRYKYLKRIFDFFGALIFIASLAIPMMIISLIVKFTSKGPVFFKQVRLGQFGQPFQFLKFRSMRAGADTQSHQEYVTKLIHGKLDEINNGSEENPVFKMVDDPRITPFGKIMRKTSLDEIPQFFNVLKGEMSLVGPRPPIPYEVQEYKDWHLRRISDVKPGITGLWQVFGRNSTTFDDMVRYDIEYVDKWSLLRDLKILLLTVRSVLDTTGN